MARAGQPLQQQRIMRAGEHDGVGARGVGAIADEAGGELGRDVLVAHPRPLSAASASERALRSRPGSPRSPREIRISALGVFALHGASVPSTETRLVFDEAQAGLIAGTVPTKGRVGVAQMRHDQGGRRVAGDHDEVGLVGLDQLADQRHHAGDDLVLGVVAIGEEGVVGDIDVMRVGARGTISRSTVSPPRPESNTRIVGGVDTVKSLSEGLPFSFWGGFPAADWANAENSI